MKKKTGDRVARKTQNVQATNRRKKALSRLLKTKEELLLKANNAGPMTKKAFQLKLARVEIEIKKVSAKMVHSNLNEDRSLPSAAL